MKKAITPVISVILLIMLVVAITGGAWYWMTNVQSNLQENAGSSIEQTSDISTTSFSIVSAICNSTQDTVNVSLINTGSAAIASTTKYIVTVSTLQGTTLGTDLEADKSTSGAVDPDSGIEIMGNFSGSVDLTSGTKYNVRVNIGSSSQNTVVTCN